MSTVLGGREQVRLRCTFTFGEDSMLSSAEAVIRFGPMRKTSVHVSKRSVTALVLEVQATDCSRWSVH